MYSLAKLLTEEPEKLERIGLLFLKLLVTLFIGSAFFGLNISISEFVQNPIPNDYTLTNFVFFLILLVVIWFTVWTFIAEIIIGQLIIWAVSKIGNSKSIFNDVLAFINVIKKKGDNIAPAKNVIAFSDMLQNYSDEDEKIVKDSKSRIRQYYLVTTVIYFTLIFAKDINFPCWLKWFGGIMSFNFLLGSAISNKLHEYFTDNLDEMKKQFSRLAYAQMIIKAIEQNPFLKQHYEKGDKWMRIHLKRKTEDESLPETFKFYPVFHWNEGLTKIMLDKGLEQRSGKELPPEKIGKHYDVVVCNIKPDDKNIKDILSQPSFVYLHCETEEQVYKNIEVLLFQVTKGMYSIY